MKSFFFVKRSIQGTKHASFTRPSILPLFPARGSLRRRRNLTSVSSGGSRPSDTKGGRGGGRREFGPQFGLKIREGVSPLGPGGGGVLPYTGLMGTCGQPGYVFRDFRLKQGMGFIIFCLNQGIDLSIFVSNRINVLNRVSKIGILS